MILNIIGYYAVWWSLVFFSKTGRTDFILFIFFINLLLHFYFNVKIIKKEILTISLILLSGLLLDLFFNFLKIFSLNSNFYFWLPLIWITFATTIHSSLAKVLSNKSWVIFILGFVGGPLSYYSASKFQLLVYTHSMFLTFTHALVWGFFICYLKFIKEKINANF